jgi:hypothetical protein
VACLVFAPAVAFKLPGCGELYAAFGAEYAADCLLGEAHFGVAGVGVRLPIVSVKFVARGKLDATGRADKGSIFHRCHSSAFAAFYFLDVWQIMCRQMSC